MTDCCVETFPSALDCGSVLTHTYHVCCQHDWYYRPIVAHMAVQKRPLSSTLYRLLQIRTIFLVSAGRYVRRWQPQQTVTILQKQLLRWTGLPQTPRMLQKMAATVESLRSARLTLECT